MFMWRNDKQLMEDSLKKAFRLRECDADDRFATLLRRLREQDERMKRRQSQPA